MWSRSSTSFFSIWTSSCPVLLVEKTIFPHGIVWHSCEKLIYCALFLYSHFYSTDLYVSSYDSTTLHCCFRSKLWNQKRESSYFVFFKTILRYSGSSAFPYEFKDKLVHVCKKPTWDFGWLGLHWIYIGQFGECWILNNIQSSDPWTWDIFMFT